jgi:hypothetical protein
MKIYVINFALTSGIMCVDAEPCSDISPELMQYGRHGFAHKYGRDWVKTREEAISAAEKMRDKKIASLEKQIEKLRAMTFEVEE